MDHIGTAWLLTLFLEVLINVFWILQGSCSSAHQTKGTSKETFIRTSMNKANNQTVVEKFEKDDAS